MKVPLIAASYLTVTILRGIWIQNPQDILVSVSNVVSNLNKLLDRSYRLTSAFPILLPTGRGLGGGTLANYVRGRKSSALRD